MGARELHVWPEEPREAEGHVTLAARLEGPDAPGDPLWFRLPARFAPRPDAGIEAFALGLVFRAMERGCDLVLHGSVSPSLLANLEEFQATWACWCPDLFRVVEIRADVEKEPAPAAGGGAVCAFTGGVDSSYTVWRHFTGHCGRGRRTLEAGVFVHGFDVPLSQPEAFTRAAVRAEQTLQSAGLELVTMATNQKPFCPRWDQTHGAAIAACLWLVAGRWRTGLVASTWRHGEARVRWGSNPLTDRLLGGTGFEIVHDAAEVGRADKLAALVAWPDAFQRLRVCWKSKQRDLNCGRCQKCVLTLLGIELQELPRPASFPEPLGAASILGMRALDGAHFAAAASLLAAMRRQRPEHPLLPELARCVDWNRRRLRLSRPARHRLVEPLRRLRLGRLERRGP